MGAVDENVSAVISSLHPATAYHFRLVATNAGGTTLGADQTLTTLVRPVGHASIPARAQVKNGKALVPLTCKGSALAECSGTLKLRARIQKGIRFILVSVGTATYDFFGQHTETITVRLNANGDTVLAQPGGQPVPASARAGGANRELRLYLKGAAGNSEKRGKSHR